MHILHVFILKMTTDNIIEDEFFSLSVSYILNHKAQLFLACPLGPRLEQAGSHGLPHITCYGDYGNISPLGH